MHESTRTTKGAKSTSRCGARAPRRPKRNGMSSEGRGVRAYEVSGRLHEMRQEMMGLKTKVQRQKKVTLLRIPLDARLEGFKVSRQPIPSVQLELEELVCRALRVTKIGRNQNPPSKASERERDTCRRIKAN